MAFQDVPDGLVADLLTEVANGTCDAVVPPIAVFRGQSDNEALELWTDPWATRIRSLFRAIELPGDQPPVSGQDRVRTHDGGDLRQRLAPESLADLREVPSFAVAQRQRPGELVPQNAVLRHEILVSSYEARLECPAVSTTAMGSSKRDLASPKLP